MSEVTELKRLAVQYRRLGLALIFSSLTSISFYIVGAINSHSRQYSYLEWNLFLAWLPLLFAVWLVSGLPSKGWSNGRGVVLTLLWLIFLPNSFYMASDLIHLLDVNTNALFNAVMFLSFVFNGLVLGFGSLYLIHNQLLKRLTVREAHAAVAIILLLCSFAIYLGRDLRWNSWDLITNPFGILFDVSDRFINPGAHPEAYTTTLAFFVLLSSMYLVIWQITRTIHKQRLVEQ